MAHTNTSYETTHETKTQAASITHGIIVRNKLENFKNGLKNIRIQPRSLNSFKLPNGDNYTGEFNENGLKHGIGQYTWKTEDIDYQGDWDCDKMCGKGVIVYKNGDRYLGGFMNDKFHGDGQYFWARDNSSVKGKFRDGELEGSAVYNASDDQIWQGTFFAKQGATGLSFQLNEQV